MPIKNLLAQQHQARLNASIATTEEERAAYLDLDAIYEARIEAWRAALDAPLQDEPPQDTAQATG